MTPFRKHIALGLGVGSFLCLAPAFSQGIERAKRHHHPHWRVMKKDVTLLVDSIKSAHRLALQPGMPFYVHKGNSYNNDEDQGDYFIQVPGIDDSYRMSREQWENLSHATSSEKIEELSNISDWQALVGGIESSIHDLKGYEGVDEEQSFLANGPTTFDAQVPGANGETTPKKLFFMDGEEISKVGKGKGGDLYFSPENGYFSASNKTLFEGETPRFAPSKGPSPAKTMKLSPNQQLYDVSSNSIVSAQEAGLANQELTVLDNDSRRDLPKDITDRFPDAKALSKDESEDKYLALPSSHLRNEENQTETTGAHLGEDPEAKDDPNSEHRLAGGGAYPTSPGSYSDPSADHIMKRDTSRFGSDPLGAGDIANAAPKGSSYGEPQVSWNICDPSQRITGYYSEGHASYSTSASTTDNDSVPVHKPKSTKCSPQKTSKVFFELFKDSFGKCVEESYENAGGRSAIQAVDFSHIGVTGDSSHRAKGRSLHNINRAMDLTGIYITTSDGQLERFTYALGSRAHLKGARATGEERRQETFWTSFRSCWNSSAQQHPLTKNDYKKGASIGWENSKHRNHLHISAPLNRPGFYNI